MSVQRLDRTTKYWTLYKCLIYVSFVYFCVFVVKNVTKNVTQKYCSFNILDKNNNADNNSDDGDDK